MYNLHSPLAYAYDLMYCITYMTCTINTTLLFTLLVYCIIILYTIYLSVQCTQPSCVRSRTNVLYTICDVYNIHMYCITYMMCRIYTTLLYTLLIYCIVYYIFECTMYTSLVCTLKNQCIVYYLWCVQYTQPSCIRSWSIVLYTIFDVYNLHNPLVYAYDIMYCITYIMCTI